MGLLPLVDLLLCPGGGGQAQGCSLRGRSRAGPEERCDPGGGGGRHLRAQGAQHGQGRRHGGGGGGEQQQQTTDETGT